ncbi:MAG: hypothetical protein EPO67_15725 [Reyranella sp.]|nr:MAG: hypothetical protein EPO67_15725 [Reyranella sp.]
MRKAILAAMTAVLASVATPALAADELVTTRTGNVPYILTTQSPASPRYAVILMPGGQGILNPRIESGKLVFAFGGNFLIRSRGLFADPRFVAASTDATTSPDRILAIVQDLQARYGPQLQVYVVGTSRSTDSTRALSGPLDGKVAGFVHTSSMNAISGLSTRGAKSRHLIVWHRSDPCRATKPSASAAMASSNGIDWVEMTGGTSVGEDCEARSHHGYNGIERETVDRIKAWIAKGG